MPPLKGWDLCGLICADAVFDYHFGLPGSRWLNLPQLSAMYLSLRANPDSSRGESCSFGTASSLRVEGSAFGHRGLNVEPIPDYV